MKASRSAAGFTKRGEDAPANASTRAIYDRQMHRSYDESMVTRGRDGLPSDFESFDHDRRRGRRSFSGMLGNGQTDPGVVSHAARHSQQRRASLKSLPKDLADALLANEVHEAKALFMEADEGRKALHTWLAVLAAHKVRPGDAPRKSSTLRYFARALNYTDKTAFSVPLTMLANHHFCTVR